MFYSKRKKEINTLKIRIKHIMELFKKEREENSDLRNEVTLLKSKNSILELKIKS